MPRGWSEDNLPFPLSSQRVGCLAVPQDDGTVRLLAVVSPLPGKAMTLPVVLVVDGVGDIDCVRPDVIDAENPFIESCFSAAASIAHFAAATMGALEFGILAAQPGASVDRENAKRAKRGLPPRIGCDRVVPNDAAVALTEVPETRIGWMAIDDRDSGQVDVFEVVSAPPMLLRIQARAIARTALLTTIAGDAPNETAHAAMMVLESVDDMRWRNGAAVTLTRLLGTPMALITRVNGMLEMAALTPDDDPSSDAARDELEAYVERERASAGYAQSP